MQVAPWGALQQSLLGLPLLPTTSIGSLPQTQALREARARFLAFATTWTWRGNFRDFNASVTRMATLAEGGRITEAVTEAELNRLHGNPAISASPDEAGDLVTRVLGPEAAERIEIITKKLNQTSAGNGVALG